MKFKDLKKSVTNGNMPIYLIEGEDAYLRTSAINILKDAFITFTEFNFDVFEGEQIKLEPDAFFATVSTYPFMAKNRMVVVNEFYPTATELKGKMLKRIFSEDFEPTILVIANVKKHANLEKLERVTTVDCSKLEPAIIVKWIRTEASKENIVVSTETAEKLIDFCRADMTKISAEVAKLIAYVGKNGEITSEAVETLTTKDAEYQVYELAENIAKGKNDKALYLLKDMLSKFTDKQRLFTTVYYHFRKLFYCAISACDNHELAVSLGTEEWSIRKSREQAKNFTPKRLKFINDKLGYLDGAFKSGEVTLDDAIWNSVLNILIS